MICLLTLSGVITAAYLAFSVRKGGGIPESLSATYYTLGSYKRLFQVAMVMTACTLYPVWISVSSEGIGGLVFGACASLLFVATAPCFRSGLEGKVHYAFAAVCCICAVVWQVCMGLWDVTLWCGLVGLMLSLQDRRNWCWWVECAVIGSVYANLIRLI